MNDIADICRSRGVRFEGQVYMPEKYRLGDEWSSERVFNLSELLISMLELGNHTGQSLTVRSSSKNGWFTLQVVYQAESGDFPEEPQECLMPESFEILERLRTDMDRHGSVINVEYFPELRRITIAMHISGGA
jgi:hypothetical protein